MSSDIDNNKDLYSRLSEAVEAIQSQRSQQAKGRQVNNVKQGSGEGSGDSNSLPSGEKKRKQWEINQQRRVQLKKALVGIENITYEDLQSKVIAIPELNGLSQRVLTKLAREAGTTIARPPSERRFMTEEMEGKISDEVKKLNRPITQQEFRNIVLGVIQQTVISKQLLGKYARKLGVQFSDKGHREKKGFYPWAVAARLIKSMNEFISNLKRVALTKNIPETFMNYCQSILSDCNDIVSNLVPFNKESVATSSTERSSKQTRGAYPRALIGSLITNIQGFIKILSDVISADPENKKELPEGLADYCESILSTCKNFNNKLVEELTNWLTLPSIKKASPTE